jgi:hypothetical protein
MRLDWALFISLIGWTKRVAVRAVRAVAVIGVDLNANGGGGVVSCVGLVCGRRRWDERKILIKANDIKKL